MTTTIYVKKTMLRNEAQDEITSVAIDYLSKILSLFSVGVRRYFISPTSRMVSASYFGLFTKRSSPWLYMYLSGLPTVPIFGESPDFHEWVIWSLFS